jgi:hydrogenase maturation protease
MQATPRIAVLGLGNILMQDDGFGPTVAAMLLASHDFPPEVSVFDAGTPGLDLTPHISSLDALVLVDTVRAQGRPGEVRLYRNEQLHRVASGPRLTPHDPGVAQTLQMLELEGTAPREVLLVGVIPHQVQVGVGLSTCLRNAIPEVLAQVLRELERLGAGALPREQPQPADLWWEQS